MPDTTYESLAGTSGIEHVPAGAAVVTKSLRTAGGPAALPQAIGQTNVTSIFWGFHTLSVNGVAARNFGFPGVVQVFSNSQVAVTLCEIDQNGTPFLGQARMSVLNVVPQNDGTVTVRFHVDWGSPLRVLVNFIIVN